MTRNVTFALCVAGLALGGCYDHRTVEEADISPIEAEDAGTELPDDGDDGDDGDGNGGEDNNGGDNEGDNEGPNGPPDGMGPFGDLDCENPPDRITELLCGLQDGGGGMGGSGGGFPGSGGQSGGGSGRPGGTTGGMGPTTGGQPGPTTGGNGMPSTPEEIIQEIIENLDCEMDEPDFLTQILCALTGEGGGFPGGGFPGGGGGGGGNGFPF